MFVIGTISGIIVILIAFVVVYATRINELSPVILVGEKLAESFGL
jgi:hypothetical protein